MADEATDEDVGVGAPRGSVGVGPVELPQAGWDHSVGDTIGRSRSSTLLELKALGCCSGEVAFTGTSSNLEEGRQGLNKAAQAGNQGVWAVLFKRELLTLPSWKSAKESYSLSFEEVPCRQGYCTRQG